MVLYGHYERFLSADKSTWGEEALDQSRVIQISNTELTNKRDIRNLGKTDLSRFKKNKR